MDEWRIVMTARDRVMRGGIMHGKGVRRSALALALTATTLSSAIGVGAGDARAYPPDNKRLNSGVFANIYTAQKQNGCLVDPEWDGRLNDAARRHALDVLNNGNTNGDIGSDGSTAQQRAINAGFKGPVAETVAINPSLAINNLDVLTQWWNDPASRGTMQDCRYTALGVWSENSLARSVVVATYGQPQ
jgi:uncharacterized protein YkwD